ncbi:hypothetical protein B7R54_02380 [Subtercola boreus]|uniref:MFS transporter permease n=1 Tax=Subtercola boreus TaxID=120213 RepID=A0A3E0VF67_9MICO|nr:hypothetical protein [Subtercola boreus]RFA08193.1 hypothetical protein B7R54_02380 [Subtercola boreus]TQL54914.1 hypothetical protein FB464_2464 [Subtercola boreus]
MRSRSIGTARRRRSRAVWAALITGVVLCILIVAGVLLPVLGLIGAADATTIGALNVPVGAIIASIVISYLVALGFLALTFVSRIGALAWIAATAAVIATLVGSVWPLVATALSSVSQIENVIPFIQQLITQVTNR